MAPFWAACSLFLPMLLFGSLSGPVRAAEPASSPLVLERIIPLPSVSGRIDHMAVDLRRGRLFVAELGDGTVDVVDLAAGKVTHRIAGLKEPQGIGYSPQADVIAVASAGQQVASWQVSGLKANLPMALDIAGAILATMFRGPPRLALLDTKTGVVTASLPICGDADDVFFDAKRRRIYVSGGEGLVDVLQGDTAGYHPLAHIPTHSGARTSLFVPELDRLFVVARAGLLGSDAALLVFRPGP